MRGIADSLQVFEKNGGDDETRTRGLFLAAATFDNFRLADEPPLLSRITSAQ